MNRAGSLFWWFLPEGAEILVIVGVALALMVGIFSRKKAFGILGMLVLFLVAEPFIESLLNVLPLWVLILIMAAIFLSLLRTLLGKGIFDQMVGQLLANAVTGMARLSLPLLRLPFRAMLGAVRLLGRGLRWLFRGAGQRRASPAPPAPPQLPGHYPQGYWED